MGAWIISLLAIFWCCVGLSYGYGCMSKTCHGHDVCSLNLHNGVLHGTCTSHHHYNQKNDCQNKGQHITEGFHCQCTSYNCVKTVVKHFVGVEDNLQCFHDICDHNNPACVIRNNGDHYGGGCHHSFMNFCQTTHYHLGKGDACRCTTQNCILLATGQTPTPHHHTTKVTTTERTKATTTEEPTTKYTSILTTQAGKTNNPVSNGTSTILPMTTSTGLPVQMSTEIPAKTSTVLSTNISTLLPGNMSTNLPIHMITNSSVQMSTNSTTSTSTPIFVTTSEDKCVDLPGVNCTEFTAVYACGAALTDKYCAKFCGHCSPCADLPGTNCTELMQQGDFCSTQTGIQNCRKSCKHCTAILISKPDPFGRK